MYQGITPYELVKYFSPIGSWTCEVYNLKDQLKSWSFSYCLTISAYWAILALVGGANITWSPFLERPLGFSERRQKK